MSDRESNVKQEVSLGGFTPSQLLIGLAIICAVAALMDFRHFAASHDGLHDEHHGGHEPHVRFESWFNFFGFASILATFAMVFVAKLFSGVLNRGEGYYDE